MKKEETSNKNSNHEDKLEAEKAKRKKLMEEVEKHLKGGVPLSKEELSEDPYINYKKNN